MRGPVAVARSLEGRALAVLLAAVLVVHASESVVYHRSETSRADDAFAREVGSRLKLARDALARRPADERADEARALSTAHFEIGWTSLPVAGDGMSETALRPLRDRILRSEPSLGPSLRLAMEKSDDPLHAADMGGVLSMPDGTGGLTFRSAHVPDVEGHAFWKRLAYLLTVLIAVAAVAVMHWVARPLRELARATTRIGRGETVAVPEVGPDETRAIAHALNRMQARIGGLVEARTHALAAVSHDLRTPIARLRLRLDGSFDDDQRASMAADLDEMQAMIDATLAYLRGQADPEPGRIVNVGSLAMSVADAFADTGRDVTFEGSSRALARVRPTAMRRALSNLVDNATRYGTRARLTLATTDDRVVLRVDDDGPGIPTEDLARAFEPFVRLEGSRNRDAGGTGLGLTIALQTVLAERGTLTLSNGPTGLRAEVSLPRVAASGRCHDLPQSRQAAPG